MTPPVGMSADTITIRPKNRGPWRRVRAAFGLLFRGEYNLGPSEVVLTNPEWAPVPLRIAILAPAAPLAPLSPKTGGAP